MASLASSPESRFFQFPEGIVDKVNEPVMARLAKKPEVFSVSLKLKEGDRIPLITSSLDRYGGFIISGNSYFKLCEDLNRVSKALNELIVIQTC